MKILYRNTYGNPCIWILVLQLFSCQMDSADPGLIVKRNPENGQYIFEENNKTILQYNYQTVYDENVVRLEDAKPENYNRRERDTFVTAELYAIPRSNYIHPLYGLKGEMLTRDWPAGGHPHHRGIFWAWPEVQFGSEQGDIYALQKVFARPTGRIEMSNEKQYAQLQAENIWRWEDREAIVNEQAIIRVYEKNGNYRIIDLAFRFNALKDSITIATRNTDSYGGLNIRMQTPDNQKIQYHTDSTSQKRLRAWSDFSGIFENSGEISGMVVLQHSSNPEYPGDWVEYPDLSWVQPTFPTPGSRFLLTVNEPLELKYRIVVYEGELKESGIYQKWWDDYHSENSSIPFFRGQ
ncbi:DUF6807 family protein [Membranihabitans maritimus]|uniref:DUF6807 family protein n=1 Tax=Membranihabitans maritimus TaxID=2904244 RepID=UPI001F20388D|nr:DUF6807 family protein [Membranihabitans maritimus]